MGLFGKTTKDGSLDRRYKSNSGGYLGKGIRFVSDVSSIISIYNKRKKSEDIEDTEEIELSPKEKLKKGLPLLILLCVLIIIQLTLTYFNKEKEETQILENPYSYEEEVYEEVQYNDNPYNDK